MKKIPALIQKLLDAMQSVDEPTASRVTGTDATPEDFTTAASYTQAAVALLPEDPKKSSAPGTAARRLMSVCYALGERARGVEHPAAMAVFGHAQVKKHGSASSVLKHWIGEVIVQCDTHGVPVREHMANLLAREGKKGFVQKAAGKSGPEAKAIYAALGVAALTGAVIDGDVTEVLATYHRRAA